MVIYDYAFFVQRRRGALHNLRYKKVIKKSKIEKETSKKKFVKKMQKNTENIWNKII